MLEISTYICHFQNTFCSTIVDFEIDDLLQTMINSLIVANGAHDLLEAVEFKATTRRDHLGSVACTNPIQGIFTCNRTDEVDCGVGKVLDLIKVASIEKLRQVLRNELEDYIIYVESVTCLLPFTAFNEKERLDR